MIQPRLAGQQATPLAERGIGGILWLAAALSVLVTAGLVLVLAGQASTFFREVSIVEFLTNTEWTPLFAEKNFGILPLLAGTMMVTAIGLVVALPLGVMSAIYLGEFAPPRVRGALKPMLEVLAGIPTVVFGYFALITVTPALQGIIPGLAGFNAISPGVVIGIMLVPMISSLSEDAIHSVPAEIREGALALGASRLSTVLQVTLPSARSGILAATTLAVGRAVGETMVVAIAAGQQPVLTADPRVPIETMTAFMVKVSMGDTPAGTLEYHTIFAVGAALFVITLFFNMLAMRFARAARRA